MILYAGSPTDVHRHFAARVAALDDEIRQVSRVMLPGRRLARALAAAIPAMPAPLIFSEWARRVLPQNIMEAPAGTWEFLSGLIPDSYIPRASRQTPGYNLGVANTVREGRLGGLRQVHAHPDQRLPWPDIFAWFDQQFSGTLSDGLRLHDFAAAYEPAPAAPPGVLLVYGFGTLLPPWMSVLRSWGDRGALEVWTIAGKSEGWIGGLEHAADHVVHLESDGSGVGFRRQVRTSAGYDLFDAAMALVSRERESSSDPVILVESEHASSATWVRALSRAGLARPSAAVKGRDRALWDLFIRLVSGPATAAMLALWSQCAASATPAWLEEWRRRVRTVARFSDLHALLTEAARVQAAVWPGAEDWARRAAAWDAFGKPDPTLIMRTLRMIEVNDADDQPWSILPLVEALWVPNARLAVVKQPFRRVEANPFRRDIGIQDVALPPTSHEADRRAWEACLSDPDSRVWVLGPEAFADTRHWTVEEAVPPLSAVDHGPYGAGTSHWYEAWRENPDHSAFTGRVDGSEVAPLMPGRFSPSAIEDFGRCPLSFLLGRLLKISPLTDDGEITAADTGQWAHRALELIVGQKKPVSAEVVGEAVTAAVHEYPFRDRLSPLFLAYHQERLAAELYEALLRDGWSPRTRSRVEVDISWYWVWPMQGRIDRLDTEDDGSLRLIDYKTGEVPNPAAVTPSNVQLLLYQKALADHYGVPVRAEYVGVSQRSEFKRRTVPWAESGRLLAVVDHLGHGMKERMDRGEFLPLPDPRLDACRRCAFQLVCPHRVVDYAREKNATLPEYVALWGAAGGHPS